MNAGINKVSEIAVDNSSDSNFSRCTTSSAGFQGSVLPGVKVSRSRPLYWRATRADFVKARGCAIKYWGATAISVRRNWETHEGCKGRVEDACCCGWAFLGSTPLDVGAFQDP